MLCASVPVDVVRDPCFLSADISDPRQPVFFFFPYCISFIFALSDLACYSSSFGFRSCVSFFHGLPCS